MISEATRRLIEHIAYQRGYETAQRLDENTLLLGSTLAPGSVKIVGGDEAVLNLQFELPAVGWEINRERKRDEAHVVVATGEGELYQILGRAFSLSVALPDNPLQTFRNATATMPRTTDAERLVVQRVGQDIFRKSLEDYWQACCAVTGIRDRSLLRASHIRPWADCTDSERLDVYNGLLLVAHLDAAFDKHLVTILATGELVFSHFRLSQEAIGLLTFALQSRPIVQLAPQHQVYLDHHRAVFQTLEAAGR